MEDGRFIEGEGKGGRNRRRERSEGRGWLIQTSPASLSKCLQPVGLGQAKTRSHAHRLDGRNLLLPGVCTTRQLALGVVLKLKHRPFSKGCRHPRQHPNQSTNTLHEVCLLLVEGLYMFHLFSIVYISRFQSISAPLVLIFGLLLGKTMS